MVFWIAYCLDREYVLCLRTPLFPLLTFSRICLRFGRSLEQSDEDIDIEFSAGLSSHHFTILSEHEKTGFDVFRSYCELSVIKGKVYKHLYSATTSEQPMPGLAGSVVMLDQKLREWKESVPKKYRPDVGNAPSFPESKVAVILLGLHFSYFNCLLSVHRVINSHDSNIHMELAKSYTSGLLSDDIVLISGSLCQNAARASIKLIQHLPGDNPAIVGCVPILGAR